MTDPKPRICPDCRERAVFKFAHGLVEPGQRCARTVSERKNLMRGPPVMSCMACGWTAELIAA